VETKLSMSLDAIIDDRKGGGEAGGERNNSAAERTPTTTPSGTNRVYVGNLPWQTSWQDLKDHFRTNIGGVVHASVFLDEDGRSKVCGIVEFEDKAHAGKAIAELNDTKIGDTDRLIFVREDREDRNLAPGRGDWGRRGRGRSDFRGGRGGAAWDHSRSNDRYSDRDRGFERKRFDSRGGRGFDRSDRSHGSFGDYDSSEKSTPSDRTGRQIYVGNLPYHTSWQDLKDNFRSAGNVLRADIITLPNGRSKGAGTILFETREEANKAIDLFHETDFQGRKLAVTLDRFA